MASNSNHVPRDIATHVREWPRWFTLNVVRRQAPNRCERKNLTIKAIAQLKGDAFVQTVTEILTAVEWERDDWSRVTERFAKELVDAQVRRAEGAKRAQVTRKRRKEQN